MQSSRPPASADTMKRLLANAPPHLVRELAARGLDLVVVDHPHRLGLIADLGCRHALRPVWPRSKLDVRAVIDMRRVLRATAPDMIHAFSPRMLAVALLASVGLRPPPSIVSFRGITRPPSHLDLGDRISFLSSRVRLHTCESNAVMDAMVQGGIPRTMCHTVYNCVHQPTLSPAERVAIRDRFEIPRESFVVGTIATIRPVKGVDLLLRAAIDCTDLADVHWLVIGGGTDRTVTRLARHEGLGDRLRMPGHVPAAGDLAGAMDVFVMPSRREGLCRALLEAMTQAVCPVVSDAGGMKEIVRDRIDGIVFPGGDVPRLAAAIRELHLDRDRLAAYGQSARARVDAMCSTSAMADRVIAAHSRLADAA